jgi:hypothetical protein
MFCVFQLMTSCAPRGLEMRLSVAMEVRDVLDSVFEATVGRWGVAGFRRLRA